MKTIKIWNDSPSEKQVREIAAILDDGQTAIMPTDTMYALVCDATDIRAVERICALKGINPARTNLSIICADISMASEYTRVNDAGYKLLKEETPGPYTVLLKTVSTLPKAFRNRKVAGVRIPANETARAVAAALGRPLLTTTIQYDDDDYATNPELIAEAYDGRVDLMVDAGTGAVRQSAVVDCSDGEVRVLREAAGL